MQPVYAKSRVCENTEVIRGIYRLSVKGMFAAAPGQFFMLRSWGLEPLLSRPISVHDAGAEHVSFLYEVRGQGTKLLSRLKAGDEIELSGPFGNGFNTELNGRVAIVGGGIGIAPLLYTAKEFRKAEVSLYAGFRDKAFGIDWFRKYVKDIFISTDSGREGHKGLITDLLDPQEYDAVLCCGPRPMMKKVTEKCMESGVPVYVSMESRMACGLGACLVCTCKTHGGNRRTCKDGPVFSGRDVIWDA